MVIRAQQNDDVLQRDDDDQRPDDQRQDAKHNLVRRRISRPDRGQHGLVHSVKRTRPDIAIDNANGAKRETPKSGVAVAIECLGTRKSSRSLIGSIGRHLFKYLCSRRTPKGVESIVLWIRGMKSGSPKIVAAERVCRLSLDLR